VKLYELQNKVGQVSKMQVEQVRSQYETAAAQIPAIKTQIAQTENALSVLLGRNPGPIARGKKLDALALPAVPPGLPSQLLERRPDLMQSEQQLVAANAQIGAAKAQYFPAISLTGALGSVSTQLSGLFSGPAGVWSYGGSIVGPIFTGGAIAGQVAQAEAQQRAALANYELAIQNAFADVENALDANANLGDQLAAQQRPVRALSEYARLARLQFTGGYTSYTTVLQAEQQLLPSELNLATIRAQLARQRTLRGSTTTAPGVSTTAAGRATPRSAAVRRSTAPRALTSTASGATTTPRRVVTPTASGATTMPRRV
jgi:multidrug efflux system outer membrane protein